MNNYARNLQQMQIVISYWTNQAIFVFSCESEEEQLGFNFNERKATISKMEGRQAELLKIFINPETNLYAKLAVICERIGGMLEDILEGASYADARKYSNLAQEVKESYQRLQAKVRAV